MHHAAHGCARPEGWARFERMRLNILFSLVAGQVCQYVWQQVYKIMFFLLGEESKKSSFFAYSLGSGRLFATGCDPVDSVCLCLFLLEDMTFFF